LCKLNILLRCIFIKIAYVVSLAIQNNVLKAENIQSIEESNTGKAEVKWSGKRSMFILITYLNLLFYFILMVIILLLLLLFF